MSVLRVLVLVPLASLAAVLPLSLVLPLENDTLLAFVGVVASSGFGILLAPHFFVRGEPLRGPPRDKHDALHH